MIKKDRMKELVAVLNEASKAYYQKDTEIMSNLEYDKLYDELVSLEKETGIVLANSPTVHVGYEVLSELEKQEHPAPMLSLDKTKEVSALISWLGNHEGVLSWKLDGLTVVLTYEGGELKNAVTRGNGEIGEVITNNAKTFVNVPKQIPYLGRLVLRGEAVIRYSDFNKMNEEIPEAEGKYKNPRNLCSGSVRQLNNEITAKRHVHFYAFALVEDVLNEQQMKETGYDNTMTGRFSWLAKQGFDVVEHFVVTKDTLEDQVMDFAARIPDNDIPSDGLVLSYNDIVYGKSLGTTAKFPRDSIAFKWADEQAQTRLLEVEWSPSRTGLINPVAVFEPVELEGTTVTRASLHNVSILRALGLGIGDEITVYKANMIIPQVADNLTRSNDLEIPAVCPACGESTTLQDVNGVQSLYCMNPLCSAKQIKGFSHFVSRNAMNIDGLSDATLEKFISMGFLKDLSDIFHLNQHEEAIVEMDGFGQKSYDNLMKSIENARKVAMAKFIYSLGISGIGLANAKVIVSYFEKDFERIIHATEEELVAIDGIGEVLAKAFCDFFANPQRMQIVNELLAEITFEKEENDSEQTLEGKTFVITGSVERFANRNELKDYIEKLGGKVTGSVSKNTDYLINNDVTSNSSKNKKARELSIPILSEEEFVRIANGEDIIG
ncbi:MAG: NAD-dependent DNA ligase LigA [Clostridium sp.]|nr:NAD-dependent DNA ligase LigA [Clostridium sp.]